MELLIFLRARLDDTEKIAREALDETGSLRAGDLYEDDSGIVERDEYPTYPWGLGTAELTHITHSHPSHVLRRVATMHALLDLHDRAKSIPAPCPGECPTCVEDTYDPRRPLERALEPCETLRALGTEYADHADYEPRWAPYYRPED
jgi:hypothetical protein